MTQNNSFTLHTQYSNCKLQKYTAEQPFHLWQKLPSTLIAEINSSYLR